MNTIHSIIKSRKVEGTNSRPVISEGYLETIGLRHPAARAWKTIVIATTPVVFMTILLIIIWAISGWLSLLILSFTGGIYLFAAYNSGVRDLIGMRMMRADVFVGVPYRNDDDIINNNTLPMSTAFNMTSDVSFLASTIAAFLWPDWSPVCILPPNPKSDYDRSRESSGFRGAQWPFVLRAVNDSTWESSVKSLLSRCGLAVFDIRKKPMDGLIWEIDCATGMLGKDRVAFIEASEDGLVYVRVADKILSQSSATDEFAPMRSELNESIQVLCTIRQWVADQLPVYKKDYCARYIFWIIDKYLSRVTVLLYLLMPVLVLVGVVWLIVDIFRFVFS